jgi:hypothetical protein
MRPRERRLEESYPLADFSVLIRVVPICLTRDYWPIHYARAGIPLPRAPEDHSCLRVEQREALFRARADAESQRPLILARNAHPESQPCTQAA